MVYNGRPGKVRARPPPDGGRPPVVRPRDPPAAELVGHAQDPRARGVRGAGGQGVRGDAAVCGRAHGGHGFQG